MSLTRHEILEQIHAHDEELRALGVASLDLFGSVARGEATPESDIDLLVAFDQPVGLFGFYRVEEYLENILGVPSVDLVLRRSVIDELKDRIYGEAVPCLANTGPSESGT